MRKTSISIDIRTVDREFSPEGNPEGVVLNNLSHCVEVSVDRFDGVTFTTTEYARSQDEAQGILARILTDEFSLAL
jgi:hypothetical protein